MRSRAPPWPCNPCKPGRRRRRPAACTRASRLTAASLLFDISAGRLAFRAAFDSCPDLEIVHVNEPTIIESSAYLLKYDSIHGKKQQWHMRGSPAAPPVGLGAAARVVPRN